MREMWQKRYQDQPFYYGDQPNAFLAAQAGWLRPGMTALAVADGEGRNGVWLAEQGLDVLSIDAAPIALEHARALAERRGVALRTECADLRTWAWPRGEFDVIVSIFAHFPPDARQAIHRAMLQALRPGGVLVLEAFTPRQLGYTSGGPKDAAMLYTPELLREDFAGARFLELAEVVSRLDEGPGHRGEAALVRLRLARPEPI